MAGEKRGGEVSARDAILANVRRSLGVTGAEEPRRFEVETRLAKAPVGIVPERGQGERRGANRDVQGGSRARGGDCR